jgi:hypothetical protein
VTLDAESRPSLSAASTAETDIRRPVVDPSVTSLRSIAARVASYAAVTALFGAVVGYFQQGSLAGGLLLGVAVGLGAVVGLGAFELFQHYQRTQ